MSISETGTPLIDVLRKCSDSTVTFSCDSSCAQQKVQVRLRDRSLRTLMEALAEWLPGTWQRLHGGGGYRLDMASESRHRRDQWWKLFLGERERALQAQRQYILAKMRAEPYRRKPTDPISPEGFDPAVEQRTAAEHGFFAALPGALQERIAGQINEAPLYSAGAVLFGTQDDEGAVVVAGRDLPPRAQDLLRGKIGSVLRQGGSAASLDGVYVYFVNGGGSLLAGVSLPDGSWLGTPFGMHVGFPDDSPALLLDHRRLLQVVDRLGRSAPDSWRRLADYQRSTVWHNSAPGQPRMDLRAMSRAAILARLGERAHIEFVADYYSQAGRPLYDEEMKRPFVGSAAAELDGMAATHDCSWKQRSNHVFLVRDNRWYRDDGLEVPDALLKRWSTWRAQEVRLEAQAHGDASVTAALMRSREDWQAEVVATLTPWQIKNGLAMFVPSDRLVARSDDKPASGPATIVIGGTPRFDLHGTFPFRRDADWIMRRYETIQFYAGLSSQQRAALLVGRLPVESLTTMQAREALYLLPRLASVVQGAGRSVRLGLVSNLRTKPKDVRYGGRLAFRIGDSDTVQIR